MADHPDRSPRSDSRLPVGRAGYRQVSTRSDVDIAELDRLEQDIVNEVDGAPAAPLGPVPYPDSAARYERLESAPRLGDTQASQVVLVNVPDGETHATVRPGDAIPASDDLMPAVTEGAPDDDAGVRQPSSSDAALSQDDTTAISRWQARRASMISTGGAIPAGTPLDRQEQKKELATIYVDGQPMDGLDLLRGGRKPDLGAELFLLLGSRGRPPRVSQFNSRQRYTYGIARRVLFAINMLVALGMLGFLGFYIYVSVQNYLSQWESPLVQMYTIEHDEIALPTLTLCQPNHPLRFAPELDPVNTSRCVWWRGPDDTPELCDGTLVTIPDSEEPHMPPFQCWQFNANASTPMVARLGGGTYHSIDVQLKPDNLTMPGLPQGCVLVITPFGDTNVTSRAIRSTRIFFNTGYVLISLSRTRISKLNGDNDLNDFITISYMESDMRPDNWMNDISLGPGQVYVTTSYRNLIEQHLVEVAAYSLSQLLGDLAGMFGTLLGLDAINLMFWGQHMVTSLITSGLDEFGVNDDRWDF